jgi:hypothetical protein
MATCYTNHIVCYKIQYNFSSVKIFLSARMWNLQCYEDQIILYVYNNATIDCIYAKDAS